MATPLKDVIASSMDVASYQHVRALYPIVVRAFYQAKVKDSKKHEAANVTEQWRYVDLPAEVKKREPNAGLTKAELERLVEWKITHGTYRPFLLPQIRKNSPEAVAEATSEARKLLCSSKSPPSAAMARKALDAACVLSGVGPATGTLILSVFDAEKVPFFEDELFAWLLPQHADKLKYNIKEYFLLLESVNDFKQRMKDDFDFDVTSPDIEKVAFVMGHLDLIPGDGDTTEYVLEEPMESSLKRKQPDSSSPAKEKPQNDTEVTASTQDNSEGKGAIKKTKASTTRGGASDGVHNNSTAPRRSTRKKKQDP